MIALALRYWQGILAVAVFAGLGAAYAGWHHHVYERGYSDAIAAIMAQDQKAINARAEAVDRLRACNESNGVWDQSTGQCNGR